MRKALFLTHKDSITMRRFLLVGEGIRSRGFEPEFLLFADHDAALARVAGDLGIRAAPRVTWFSRFRRRRDQLPRAKARLRRILSGGRRKKLFDARGDLDLAAIVPELHAGAVARFSSELAAARRMLDELRPSLVAYDTDIFSPFLAVLYAARERGIPSVSLSHAEGWTDQYAQLPRFADYYVAYSRYNCDVIARLGVPDSNVFLCGAPESDLIHRLDRDEILAFLAREFGSDPAKRKLLLPLRPSNTPTLVEKNVRLLELVSRLAGERPDVEVLVKDHPADRKSGADVGHHFDFSRHPRLLRVPADVPAANLLKACTWLVTYKSAIVSEAALLGVPTLLIDEDQKGLWPDWGRFPVYRAVQLPALEAELAAVLAGKDVAPTREAREGFTAYFRHHFDGRAVERVAEAFEKICCG